MEPTQITKGIDDFGPWFYAHDFGDGLKTTPAIPPQIAHIHDTRLAMVQAAVEQQFGERVRNMDCLDIGCHEGFYSVAMARHGMPVTPADARDEYLPRAASLPRPSAARIA